MPIAFPRLIALFCTTLLPAQKAAMTDGSGRLIVMLDVQELLPEQRALVAPRDAAPDGTIASSVDRLARFMVAVMPQLTEAGAALQPLGDHHLVVLGSPPQVAAAEAFVVEARRSLHREFQMDVLWWHVPRDDFQREVTGLLGNGDGGDAAGPKVAVLEEREAQHLLAALARTGARRTAFPQLIAPSLHRAQWRVGESVRIVRDHEARWVQGRLQAQPLEEVVSVGHELVVMCCRTKDTLAMQVELLDQQLVEPIAERTATVPGTDLEAVVQMPFVRRCQASGSFAVGRHCTAVMATQRQGGHWILVTIKAQEIGPPARLGLPPAPRW